MFSELIGGAFEQIRIGGWVMYPLIITCLWMWYLIIKKNMDMRFYTRGWRPVHECVKNIGKPDFKCALWQQKLLEGYLAEKTDDLETNEQIMDSLRAGHELFVKQDIGTIAMLAGIAPLLGLLGTVSGMIKTFSVIAEFGTGNAKALAGGISEALKMVKEAHELNLKTMIGCFIESSLAITAAAHISSLFDYIDLDGALLLKQDPFRGVEITNGYLKLPDEAGLGVHPVVL